MGINKTKVSVLIPCLNEVQNIESCIRNIFDFNPPDGGFEVIVVDGMSDDGTRDVLFRLREIYKNLIILDNPKKTVPYAMNLGIQHSHGEYLVRTDIRCTHPKNYIKDLIKLSEQTKADNVGGVLEPIGNTYVQKSIAAAYRSPIAMGGALRNRGDFVGETDAVYGGCFRRESLIEVGMYDEEMVRNQDDELSLRLRKAGGRIIQSGKIKIKYFPRTQFKQLFKQFLQYGYWKVAIFKKHPKHVHWRHFLPAALVSGFSGLLFLSLIHKHAFFALLLYCGCYMLAVSLESLRIVRHNGINLWPGIIVSISAIHLGFGVGFLIALFSLLGHFEPVWIKSLSR